MKNISHNDSKDALRFIIRIRINCYVQCVQLVAVILFFSITNTRVHGDSDVFNLNDALFFPNLTNSSGILVELTDIASPNQVNRTSVKRYAWNHGQFICENGWIDSNNPNRIDELYSATGQYNDSVWEYSVSKGVLIEHELSVGVRSAYSKTFGGRSAEELFLKKYFAKGFEIDDFTSIKLNPSSTQDFSGEFFSTTPRQKMVGKISRLNATTIRLSAWTTNHLLEFFTDLTYDTNVSAIIPSSIKYKELLDGADSSSGMRRILYASLSPPKEEFNPKVRYTPSNVLKLQNETLIGTNVLGKPIAFAKRSDPSKRPLWVRYGILAFFLVFSVCVIWYYKYKKS